MKFIFKLVGFEKGGLSSIMQVGIIQPVEDLNRTKGWPL